MQHYASYMGDRSIEYLLKFWWANALIWFSFVVKFSSLVLQPLGYDEKMQKGKWGKVKSVYCHPYLSISVGLNVKTQTIRSTLVRK